MGSSQKHFLLFPLPIWGHTRPQIALAANLLTIDPSCLITLITPGVFRTHAEDELARYHLPEDSAQRLHLVYTASEPKGMGFVSYKEMAGLMGVTVESFHEVFEALLKCEAMKDRVTGETVKPFPTPPSVTLVDCAVSFMVLAHAEEVKKRLGSECKMIMIAPLSGAFNIWGMTTDSTDRNGHLSYFDRVKKVLSGPTEDFEKLSNQWIEENEEELDIPGLGKHFVFETCPIQHDAFLNLMGPLLETLPRWDGLVAVWPTCMSPDFQTYWDKKGFPVMQIGSQLPPPSEAAKSKAGGDENVVAWRDFLDASAPNTVLYISFGTLLFPPSLLQIQTLLDVLIELKIRFQIVRGHAEGDVLEMYEPRLKDSQGRGLMVDWADQYAVLSHEAVGCFLTHGGSNSALEAIRLKVPMVFWPASGDQGHTSNALTHTHQVGIELLQVRNGYNIGRTTALGTKVEGTVEAMRREFAEVFGGIMGVDGASGGGALGKRLREGVERLAVEVGQDEAEGGGTWKAMRRLAAM